MKTYFLLTAFLISLSASAQSSKIAIDVVESNDTLIFFGSNNSKYIQDVTLKIKDTKNLEGFKLPLTLRLLPNTTDVYHQLAVTDKDYTYDFDYGHSFPSEKITQDDFIIGEDNVKLNQGIVIFEKDNCGRCERAVAYLTENNVPFQILNISKEPFYQSLMWELLQLKGFGGTTVKTPVILVDGQISYSHDSLVDFLAKLKL